MRKIRINSYSPAYPAILEQDMPGRPLEAAHRTEISNIIVDLPNWKSRLKALKQLPGYNVGDTFKHGHIYIGAVGDRYAQIGPRVGTLCMFVKITAK